MQKNLDYITTFPNFLTLQRLSFCWFLCQGLCNELLKISKTYTIDSQITVLILGQEFKYNFQNPLILEGLSANTLLTIVIPLEIKFKTIENDIVFKEKSMFINLPLMTPAATFIVNGYERVIVNQIIRSPGIYFKKNINRKLNSKNSNIKNTLNIKDFSVLESNILLKNNRIYYYSIHYLNSFNQKYLFNFLNFHNLILKDLEINIKIKLIKLFFKWLFLKQKSFYYNLIKNYSISIKNLKFLFNKIKTFKFNNKFINTKNLFNEQINLKNLKLSLSIQDINKLKIKNKKNNSLKDLYTATLIPKYGSWIHFNFKKNISNSFNNYPIKNQEFDLMIQLNNIISRPLLCFLKEIGLTNLEIFQNLKHANFFYYSKPSLINSTTELNIFSSNFSNLFDFINIFNSDFYYLGQVGRIKLNNRLNLQIDERLKNITYNDIFAIIDKLISLSVSESISDDIDHLKNRRIRSVGELLQNLFNIGFHRLTDVISDHTLVDNSSNLVDFNSVNILLKEFFNSSQLSQFLDQVNPLSFLTHQRRISGFGIGGFNKKSISFSVRDIHPSQYGRICPIETTEGENVGLISSLTSCARINKWGFLETPFWRVVNGKVLKVGNPIYLTADIEDLYKIASADLTINDKNYLTKNLITVRYNQSFINVLPFEVDFIPVSTIQIVSIAAALIPFFEHNDANRALMGSSMQRQSIPLIFSQKPIVGTGIETQIANDSRMILNSKISGIVNHVTANSISIKNDAGNTLIYKLQKYLRSNQRTCINQRPIVWKGESINLGQALTNGSSIVDNELALGKNILVAYMPWHGYNYEDAILISDRLIYDDIFTSIYLENYTVRINRNSKNLPEKLTRVIPKINSYETKFLDNEGVIKNGTLVNSGDILVGKTIPNTQQLRMPESHFLEVVFGIKIYDTKDNSFRLPNGKSGRVIEIKKFYSQTNINSESYIEKINILVAQIQKIQIGDKISGRHGNKGVISKILAHQDMPFLPDGTAIDILLNPLGVPSRMNVGQLYECLLGFAGDKLNLRFKILPFDEMYGLEMSRILINKKLRQASLKRNEGWIFNPYSPGKVILVDGRTGLEFENPITVGNAYILKLIHLVETKIHARSIGPYKKDIQQPVRGRARHGGQRFGEMEVWALESFGSAFTLRELLTIKSDDKEGRLNLLLDIKNETSNTQFGIPESFKVLLRELRSLGLDMQIYNLKEFNSIKDYKKTII